MKLKIKSLLFFLVFFTPFASLCQLTINQNKDTLGVYDNDFLKRIFYTWTTEEQMQELGKDKTLLTKSKSETKGYSLFDLSLRDSTLKNNPFAKLLQEKQFAKKRFAWTNAWATIMGWKGETYGNQLIKIVINDSAIIGKFNRSNWQEPLSFFDLKGKKLSQDHVLKNKDRIAVIYHVNSYKGTRIEWKKRTKGTFSYNDQKKKNSVKTNVPFREFVVVNEKMITHWSYGTADIKAEIISEIERLKQFQRSKEASQVAFKHWENVWFNESIVLSGDQGKFTASMCFQNDNYLFNPKRIQKIINELEVALKKQIFQIVK